MIAALLAISIIAGPEVKADVTYSRVAGEEMKMDIYVPKGNAGTSFPAVVVIHGGAWMSGKRQDMAALATQFAESGFVAATVSYRLAPKHKWPAMLDDVQTAVRFLRSHASEYQIDPKRIGATGASAGGHLSLLLGFRDTRIEKPAEYAGVSSKVGAVFNIFGPTDLRRDYPPALDSLFETVLGKKKADSAEDIRQASPVEWITKSAAPVFTLHGEADPLVPNAQAKWLKEQLDARGVRNEMRIIPRMVHGINPADPAQMDAILAGIAFVKDCLK